MMLRANDEYLDFDEVIEVEKQIKLLEDIATTDGDFSYAFNLPPTINNMRILGNPLPDNINKPVYQRIPTVLLTDGGEETFKGYLRIERLTQQVITCSFFAGNNNWFGMLAGNLRDLDWSEYDIAQTESNFAAAIFNTEGVVFPLVDNGVLSLRRNTQMKVEDFVPAIYVKTVFQKIFNSHGIKLQGELLDAPNFQGAITMNGPKNEEAITARSSFVHSTNSPNPDDDTYRKAVFTDDSTFPYFDGSADNYDLANSRYVADVKMKVTVEFELLDFSALTDGILQRYWIAIYKNGSLFEEYEVVDTAVYPTKITAVLTLDPGDYVEAWTRNDTITAPDPLTNATFKVTPIYLYYAFGAAVVPDWTQQQYVSAVLRRFNILASYNEPNKTLTLNLFERIKDKTPIDISEHISDTEIDYSEFINDYGRKSYLSDQELEADDDFKKLNMETRPYSKGVIDVNNEFLADQQDVLESEFTAPITYFHPVFDMSMEKTDFIKLEEEIKVEFSAVTTGTLGRARFTVEDGIFALSDMVRIENSTVPSYNGDWMVFSIGTGWIELGGLSFDDDGSGEVSKMNFVYNESDNVFIFHNVPLYSVSNFSGSGPFKLEATDYGTLAVAFYSIIDKGKQISKDFIYSMSFAEGDQISLTQQYFSLTTRVLNDPVKLYCTCTLPYQLFSQMDFLRPVVIRTNETQNVYYINRITGFKESYLDCVTEAIKLP